MLENKLIDIDNFESLRKMFKIKWEKTTQQKMITRHDEEVCLCTPCDPTQTF